MSSTKNQWQECETGLIGGMVSREAAAAKAQSRRTALKSIAVGGLGCLGAVALVKLNGSKKPAATQIACETVHKKLQDFVDNKINDQYQRGLISRHLFVCPECQQAYRGMVEGVDFSCDAPEATA